MEQVIQQGLSELTILFIAEIKDKAHSKMGHTLDFILEILIYSLIYLHEYRNLRQDKIKSKAKSRVTNPMKKYTNLAKLANLILVFIFLVMSLIYDNEIKHVIQNLLQGLLLFLMLKHYSQLLTFCEALLFTKICSEFLCLLFQFIPHYGQVKDIAQVADLFLISAVAVPLVSLLFFKYFQKQVFIPLVLIAIQVGVLLHIANFNPIKLITLTLSENNSILCLLYMLAITSIGIFISQVFQKKLEKIMVRKIFHFQVVLIYTGGIYIAPGLTLMASSGLIWIFFILEFLRQEFSTSIKIINRLDQFVTQFIDERDFKQLILTHIYLLLGVSYPFIYEYSLQHIDLSLYYEKALSGVLVLGIGDSFAAIIGKSIGKIKFLKTRKTLEGFLAFIGTLILFTKMFNLLIVRNKEDMIVMDDWFYIKTVFVAFVECVTKQVDNLLLPILFMSL